MGSYILDFYCHEKGIGVELDGGQHGEEGRRRYDEKRDELLRERGIRVVRFWDSEALGNVEGVMAALWEECGLPGDE